MEQKKAFKGKFKVTVKASKITGGGSGRIPEYWSPGQLIGFYS